MSVRITRYDFTQTDDWYGTGVERRDDGEWVRYEDIEVLLAREQAMREALEWIASRRDLFFAECSQAEEVVERAQIALGGTVGSNLEVGRVVIGATDDD